MKINNSEHQAGLSIAGKKKAPGFSQKIPVDLSIETNFFVGLI